MRCPYNAQVHHTRSVLLQPTGHGEVAPKVVVEIARKD